MTAYTDELRTAKAAVIEAARVCRSVQQAITPDALEKKDRSPVTVADFASQAVVCRALQAAFPNDPVVGEENADALRQPENDPFRERVHSEVAAIGIDADEETILDWIDHGNGQPSRRFWTLDPIDGTKGFLRGEQYAISLALIVENRIALGVLVCPNLAEQVDVDDATDGTMLWAVRGQGALSGEASSPGVQGVPIHVADTDDAGKLRFCESVESGHSSHGWSARVAERLGTTAEPVRLDSQAKYAVVARGEADAYLRLPTRPGYREKIWDHAGGVIVVEEAGGRVTDVDGKPLDFSRGAELAGNRGVVVTNGRLHDRVLEAVARAAEDR